MNEIREVCVKIAARHPQENGIGLLLRETTGLALGGPPGLCGFAGTRPRASPVVAMFACLLPRAQLQLDIHFEGKTREEKTVKYSEPLISTDLKHDPVRPALPVDCDLNVETVGVSLIKLAYGRSGDKGDKANIGIIARDEKFLPFIWKQLDETRVANRFSHFLATPDALNVKRYFMPGIGAINFVLDNVLEGGGTASLRNDPQGKGYAQILLAVKIEIPVEMATGLL